MKPLYLLTSHRSGSTLINSKIMPLLCFASSVRWRNISAEGFEQGLTLKNYLEHGSVELGQENVGYGAFRSVSAVRHIPGGENRFFIHLRDPRDCIVSAYFAYKYSHEIPPYGPESVRLADLRATLMEKSLEDYCLENIAVIIDLYELYFELQTSESDTYISKYEDMIENFDLWLISAAEFFGLNGDEPALRALYTKRFFHVGTEDVTRHKRQVEPGDHRRKLSPSIRNELTTRCSLILDRFGYDL